MNRIKEVYDPAKGGEVTRAPQERDRKEIIVDTEDYKLIRLTDKEKFPQFKYRTPHFMEINCGSVGEKPIPINPEKMKIERFSFKGKRLDPEMNEKLDMEILYDSTTGIIFEIRAANDLPLTIYNPYLKEICDALGRLDKISKINGFLASELDKLNIKQNHLLTPAGEIPLEEYNPGDLVIKRGDLDLACVNKEAVANIIYLIKGYDLKEEEICTDVKEVNENTKIYIGLWNPEIFFKLKDFPNIKYIYESFPDKPIFMRPLSTFEKIETPADAKNIIKESNSASISHEAEKVLEGVQFSGKERSYMIVQFSPKQLGINKANPLYGRILEKAESHGLKRCPAELGVYLSLRGLDYATFAYMAMDPIQLSHAVPPDDFDIFVITHSRHFDPHDLTRATKKKSTTLNVMALELFVSFKEKQFIFCLPREYDKPGGMDPGFNNMNDPEDI